MTAGSPTHASDSKAAAKCARPGNQADIPQHKNGLHVIAHFRNVQELRQSRELEKSPVKYLCKEAEPKACSGQWEWLSTVVTEDQQLASSGGYDVRIPVLERMDSVELRLSRELSQNLFLREMAQEKSEENLEEPQRDAQLERKGTRVATKGKRHGRKKTVEDPIDAKAESSQGSGSEDGADASYPTRSLRRQVGGVDPSDRTESQGLNSKFLHMISKTASAAADQLTTMVAGGGDDEEDIEAERLAKAMEDIEDSHEELYDAIIGISAPVTDEVLYLQLCVICYQTSNVLALKRRHELRPTLLPETVWTLDLIGGYVATEEQRVSALQTMLEKERRAVVHSKETELFSSLWLLLERYRYLRMLVKNRHKFMPKKKRLKNRKSQPQKRDISNLMEGVWGKKEARLMQRSGSDESY